MQKQEESCPMIAAAMNCSRATRELVRSAGSRSWVTWLPAQRLHSRKDEEPEPLHSLKDMPFDAEL
jgi:hypothetical protein